MADARRWWVLAILGLAQLMTVLDNSIVNVALPSAQIDLRFSGDVRSWIVTAYALAFAALLLPSGRLSDLLGRKRAFITGLAGFAGASAIGGAASGFAMLVAARAVQGAFAALLAPTVLALTTTTFPGGKERARAFGLLGALAGTGGVIGLILGGVLTEYMGWRWTMYVNVIFAAAAIVGAVALLDRERGTGRTRLDWLGAMLAGTGLLSMVFGFAHAQVAGWGAAPVTGSLAGGVALIGLFVLRQSLAPVPLLPLRVLRDRDRGAAYVLRVTVSAGNFSVTFLMAYFLQADRGLSPAMTGVAMVPTVAGIITGANLLGATLLPRFGPRPLGVGGLLLSAAAMLWLAQLSVTSSYWTGILMPLYVFGIGQGVTSTVSMSTATLNLDPRDIGVASATVNVMQQAGGSLGTALLSSISATTAAAYLAAHPGQHAAAGVHGDNLAFVVAAAWLTIAAVAVGTLARSGGSVLLRPETASKMYAVRRDDGRQASERD
jgi:EmrB/QacA subfamily drug resistance transporter